MEPRRPQALDAGLFFVVVAAPLAFFPLSRAPFAEPKLVLVAAGAVLVWLSGLRVDRRLLVPALIWFAALVVAAIFGVDLTASLLGLLITTGLATLGVGAYLLVIGPALPPQTRERTRRWLVLTGIAVAVVTVLVRLLPGFANSTIPALAAYGSPMGIPAISAGFTSTCIAAAIGAAATRTRALVVTLAILAAGTAATNERSALVLPAVALVAGLWFVRASRRTAVAAVLAVGITLAGWTLIAPLLPQNRAPAAPLEQQLQSLQTDKERLASYAANFHGFTRRPVLGWGPANTWSAYVSSASAEQIRVAGRSWGDAHDILLESLVTTGLLGTAALLFLIARVAPPVLRARGPLGWSSGAVAVLAVYHLYEPLNVVLTPLLFLLAGVACSGEVDSAPEMDRPSSLARAARAACGIALAVSLVLSSMALGASALEDWARTHYAEWALRVSLDLEPWRVTAAEALAYNLAVDGRGGDATAAREARDLIGETVRQHPWNPGVRIIAAGVEQLLRNLPGAQLWIRRQLEWFPNDSVTVPTGEPSLPTPSPGVPRPSATSS